MDYLDQWASFIGLVGAIFSFLGFAVAIVAAYRAQKARDAAEEARAATVNVIDLVDLQRAIALIQRLKLLLRERKWEVSIELYQPLRQMLNDIQGRYSSLPTEQEIAIQEAIVQIRAIEDQVAKSIRDSRGLEPAIEAEEILNEIQTLLETIASGSYFTERAGEQ